MALLDDISVGALSGDSADDKLEKVVKQLNEQSRIISNEDKTKIIKDESGTQRILFGQGSDNFYGMKVSQEGVDVYGASDDELVFNSNNNIFKIIEKDTISISAPATAGVNPSVTTVPHSLGYPPTVIAFYTYSNGAQMLPYVSVGLFGTASAGKVSYVIECFANSTDILFTFTDSAQSTAGTYNITYYIVQETSV